jgi:hypothetical protein
MELDTARGDTIIRDRFFINPLVQSHLQLADSDDLYTFDDDYEIILTEVGGELGESIGGSIFGVITNTATNEFANFEAYFCVEITWVCG